MDAFHRCWSAQSVEAAKSEKICSRKHRLRNCAGNLSEHKTFICASNENCEAQRTSKGSDNTILGTALLLWNTQQKLHENVKTINSRCATTWKVKALLGPLNVVLKWSNIILPNTKKSFRNNSAVEFIFKSRGIDGLTKLHVCQKWQNFFKTQRLNWILLNTQTPGINKNIWSKLKTQHMKYLSNANQIQPQFHQVL